MDKKKVIILGILLFEIAIALILCIDHTKKSIGKYNVEYVYENMMFAQEVDGNLEVKEEVGGIDSSNLGTNRRIISPVMTLEKGIYQVDVYYQTTTPAGSMIGSHSLVKCNDESDWINSESVMLTNKDNHVDYRINVGKRTAAKVRIEIDDECYDSINIEKITITALDGRTLLVTFIKWLFACFLINIVVFSFLYQEKLRLKALTTGDKGIILSLLIIIFLIELPMTMDYVPKGYDLRFHYYRIYSIAMGLQEGIFPVKIQPEWLNGYGYATGVFYGDILLYFPALLYVLGFSMGTAYKAYVFFINVITVLGAFFCFTKISENKYIGLAGSTAYSLSLHKLVATYTRAAVGAYSAMAFLPFVVLGLWLIYYRSEDKRSRGWMYLALGMSGLLETHVLGTLIVMIFVFLFVISLIKRTLTPNIMLQFIKAIGVTLLLNAFFIIPFLDGYTSMQLKVQEDYRSIYDYTAYVSQLFSNEYNVIGDVDEDLVGMNQDMPMSVGPISLLIIFTSVIVILACKNKAQKKNVISLLSFLMLSLWLSTNLFPYKLIEAYMPQIYKIIMKFQFAWRFQAISAILIAALTIYLLIMLKNESSKEKLLFATGIVCILFAWQGTVYIFQYNNMMIPFEHENDFRDLSVGAVYSGQYLLDGFEESDIDTMITTSDETSMEYTVMEQKKLEYYVMVSNLSDKEGYIEFPLLAYKGYRATDGEKVFKISNGENQRLRIDVPAGYCGSIRVCFYEPWYWRLSELISLISAVAICTYFAISVKLQYRKQFKERMNWTKNPE